MFFISSEEMVQDLQAAGIDCTLILDSATGYVMESVDFVMVGAEAVVESGGIINRIGSYTMGLCAREMKKPFYVLSESFKFSRLYPLNQRDLPNEYKVGSIIKTWRYIFNLLMYNYYSFLVLSQAFKWCVQGASAGGLYAACIYHAALHRSGYIDAIGRERRTDQAVHVNWL